MQVKCFLIKTIALCAAIILNSCSVGSNSTSGTNNMPIGSSDIQISNISTIPIANYSHGEYVFATITNNSNKIISLHNTQITANGKILASAAVATFVDLTDCLQIAAHNSCSAKIFTNPSFQSYLLNLTYTDTSGTSYNVNQVISFNTLLPAQNGFIYDATQLSPNNSGLTIPFRLATNYANISVLINNQPAEFSCYKNTYTVNTLCSAKIKSTNLKISSNANNTIKISGYNTNGTIKNNTILVLINSQTANIITSGQNVVINPDDGTSPQTVYLVNNGLVSATGIAITPTNPVTVTSSTCGTTLSANANCSFVINVTGSPTSGQASVAITYSNGSNAQALYFNVSYSNLVSPALTLTQSGNFTNIESGTGPIFMGINVSNTGITNLTNLQFSNLNLQENNMSSYVAGSSCYSGMSLNTGVSCTMILSYSPNAAESGTINFIPTASYTESGGQTVTYANSILNIPYSAVIIPVFVAIGDFGTVIHSTNNPPTTWVTDITSPFTATTESAMGITINNGTYVIMKNNGNVMKSTQNGLFWSSAGTTNLNASSCTVVYDGTRYLSCGTASANFGSCVNANGCILSSTTLSGAWTGLFNSASNTVQPSNIYYYVSGAAKAYIVTLTGKATNQGLATSTTGTSFTAASSGLSTANATLLGTAFNTTANTITAWSSTGFNTTANFGSILLAWTPNTISRPASAANPVRAAIFQNGRYHVGIAGGGTNTGNIYTSTASNGAYTAVYTGGSATKGLNSMTYGNGTYLAVGDNSAIVESAPGSIWSVKNTFFGSATLNFAYYESTLQNFWVTGNGVIGWTPAAATTPSWSRPGPYNIARNGNNYLIVDKLGGIESSSNLTTWTNQINPSGKTMFHLYCIGNNTCFAVGESGVILKTTNGGNNWIQQTSNVSTNTILHSIICNFNTCVAVGGTGAANSGTVAITTDLTNWSVPTSSLNSTSFIAAAYYNGQYIAAGISGSMFVSTNGTSWQQITSPNALDIYSIACGNQGCVAVGNTGNIWYSSNAESWVTESAGTSQQLNCVAYNGVFVAVGQSGIILQSADGITWSPVTFPAGSASNTGLVTVTSNL